LALSISLAVSDFSVMWLFTGVFLSFQTTKIRAKILKARRETAIRKAPKVARPVFSGFSESMAPEEVSIFCWLCCVFDRGARLLEAVVGQVLSKVCRSS
jgi:hypothetical protein